MKQQQLCVNCNNWIIAPRDQYCGWCDMRFSGFEMSLSQEIFFLGAEKGKKEIDLIIKSSGHGGQVKILDIRADSDLVTVVNPLQKPVALSGKPEGDRWKLNIDFIRAKEALQEIDIHVLSDLKADDAQKTKTIRLVPRPDFALKTEKDLAVVLDGENRETNQVTLVLNRGWANVTEIKPTKMWATVQASLPAALSEDGQKELLVRLSLDEDMVSAEIDSGKETTPLKLQLRVICQGMETKPYDLPPVTISTQRPAKLFIDEVVDIPVDRLRQTTRRCIRQEVFIKSRRRFAELELTLRNNGDAPLQIEDAEVVKSEAPSAFEVPSWLAFEAKPILKTQIKSGDIRLVAIKVDTAAMPEEEKEYEFNLKFYCASAASGRDWVETLPLLITAKKLHEYPGIVAIDFGTTNTCVAVYNPETMTEPKPLKLDRIGIEDSSSVPSVILYRQLLDDNVRHVLVGRDANARFATPGTEESLIASIKREVGQEKPRMIRYYDDPDLTSHLKPEEIAQDIINEVLAEVEQTLKYKVKTCAISHPVQYVHRRIDALERAFKQAGVAIDEKLTEPLAAALDYVFRHEDTAQKSYKLMVFDFGGGTTDIAYLQVTVQKAENGTHNIIVPLLLGSDGDRRFGGDDVTTAVMQYFGGICQEEVMKKLGPGVEVILDLDQIREIADHNARRMALLSYRALLQAAEDAKIYVSDKKVDSKPTNPLLYFWHEQKELKFASPPLVLTPAKLEDLVKEALENVLNYIADLIEANNNVFPDVILLVGNSSRLPIVRRRIDELFGGSGCKVVGAGTDAEGTIKLYKEAVVMGLGRHCMSQIQATDIRVKPLQKRLVATSHIGIRKFSGGRMVFAPIIKKGGELNTWHKLENVTVSRKTKLSILSCSGRDMNLNNKRYIEDIAQFPIAQAAEKFSEEELERAEYFLQVSSNEHVLFKVKIGEHEQEFKAEIPIPIE